MKYLPPHPHPHGCGGGQQGCGGGCGGWQHDLNNKKKI